MTEDSRFMKFRVKKDEEPKMAGNMLSPRYFPRLSRPARPS